MRAIGSEVDLLLALKGLDGWAGVRGVFWGYLFVASGGMARTIDESAVAWCEIRDEIGVAHTMNPRDGVMKKSFNHSSFLRVRLQYLIF